MRGLAPGRAPNLCRWISGPGSHNAGNKGRLREQALSDQQLPVVTAVVAGTDPGRVTSARSQRSGCLLCARRLAGLHQSRFVLRRLDAQADVDRFRACVAPVRFVKGLRPQSVAPVPLSNLLEHKFVQRLFRKPLCSSSMSDIVKDAHKNLRGNAASALPSERRGNH